MGRRKSEKDKELADNARLLRACRHWHREQLEKALNGLHGSVMARLMAELKNLHSARQLVAFTAAQDWNAIDADTRLVALHEINAAITALRERMGQTPIDDALPGERENAFRTVKQSITPNPLEQGSYDLVRATPKFPLTGNRPGVPVKQETQS